VVQEASAEIKVQMVPTVLGCRSPPLVVAAAVGARRARVVQDRKKARI